MAARRWARALGVLCLLVTACSSTPGDGVPSPAPSPGASPVAPAEPTGPAVAFVVAPPASDGDVARAALRTAVDEVAVLVADRVGSVRVLEADTPGFLQDLVLLAAEEGADLVCVLGRGSAAAAVRAASSFPGTRFCTNEAPADRPPGNVRAVPLDLAEFALVGGFVAAVTVPSAPPALLTPPPADPPAPFVDAFRVGAGAARAGDPVVLSAAITADASAGVEAARLLAAGAAVLVDVSGGPAAPVLAAVRAELDPSALVALSETLAAADPAAVPSPSPSPVPTPEPTGTAVAPAPTPTPSPGPGALPDPELDPAVAPLVVDPSAGGAAPAGVLLLVTVDRVAQLLLVVEELLAGWVGGVEPVGFTEGVLGVAPGSLIGSEAAVTAAADAVARLLEGELVVPSPSPAPQP